MSPSMTGRTSPRAAALRLALTLKVGLAAAGEGPREDNDVKALQAGPTRTGKERLGGKASDEQRVDNCKVRSTGAVRPRARIHASMTRIRDRRADLITGKWRSSVRNERDQRLG